jgi:hypothetical protein
LPAEARRFGGGGCPTLPGVFSGKGGQRRLLGKNCGLQPTVFVRSECGQAARFCSVEPREKSSILRGDLMPDNQEISEVRAQEEQRGKNRPQNISELRRRMILRKKFKEALEKNDEAGFIEAIVNGLGQLPGIP